MKRLCCSGWTFPARITAVFLVISAVTLTMLSYVGLTQISSLNALNTDIRIDRAARTAGMLVDTRFDGIDSTSDETGSPAQIAVDDPDVLAPGAVWNDFVDQVSEVNQGAANVFRFDSTAETFDRVATSFTTPTGERVGDSQIEPGLITAGHPAFDALVAGKPYTGEVPVAGRNRVAYLTPVVIADGTVVGAIAVDVGFSDDLNRVNTVARRDAIIATSVLLVVLTVAGGLVMLIAFRPLNQLIKVAKEMGSGSAVVSVPLTDRRGEIGSLATALAQAVDLQTDLSYRALHDDLTSLPNRAYFLQELGARIDSLGGDDGFAVILLDLDQFKEVNDGLGHSAGDELLLALAGSMAAELQPDEFLCRLGGDEFALITGSITSEVDADLVAGRLTESIRGVTRTSVAEIAITASMGVVLVPQQADTPAVALSHADLALYRAKRAGRGHWQFYQSTLATPTQRRVHLATALRAAIGTDQIRLEFQPIMDIENRSLQGFEALARWDHPEEGAIPPDEFIAVAENAGLINDLGNDVLRSVCAQIRAWRDLGAEVPPIAVNVSAIQLWQHDFPGEVMSALSDHGLTADALCIEITESVIVHHADGRSRDVLRQLSDAGIKLSIDDFGTGYSSLQYLADLTVHKIKIDRTFIADTVEGTDADRLFGGIASLGIMLGLDVVAEGIETEAEFAIAQRNGCSFAQGYLLSRPLRPAAAAEWLSGYTLIDDTHTHTHTHTPHLAV